MSNALPYWVYDLITAVEDYEDVHGEHEAGWTCLESALKTVPERELDRARVIAAYGRQKPAPEPTMIHRTEYVAAKGDAVETLVAAVRMAS